ncbi:MAG: translation initiation factor IF-3 [Patescibacteria group bacterium]
MRIHRHRQRKPKFDIPQFKVNRSIKAPEVRVIGAQGEMHGVITIDEALSIAREAGLDLIEVSPKANPPVCKIMDFSNFKYQKEKEAKKQRAQSKEVETKGVRLSMRIGINDLNVRLNQANKFLEKGHKVRIEMIMRGREKEHFNRAREIVDGFIAQIQETYEVRVESPMKRAGNRVDTIIARTK